MKWLLAGLLILALVLPLGAETVHRDIAKTDGSGRLLSNGSFFTYDAGVETLRYSTHKPSYVDTVSGVADSVAIWRTSINPEGFVGWFNFQIPEEATLSEACFQFYEVGTADSLTYTAGPWLKYYIGESYKRDGFEIGGWGRVRVVLVGSADGKVPLYWWTENFKD